MSYDPTESTRREMLETNQPHVDLAHADQTWDTAELTRDFTVHAFAAPFVIVTRKSDGQKGCLEFTHSPRKYFGFLAGD